MAILSKIDMLFLIEKLISILSRLSVYTTSDQNSMRREKLFANGAIAHSFVYEGNRIQEFVDE